jgi:ribosomal protein S1
MPGFVPASQVAIRDVRQLGKLVGKTLRLRVLEVDRRRNQIILSHRQVIEEERERRRKETLARLREGVVCEGRVRNITPYGAFIDLGGVDGLLHISEMSWTHIDDASEVVKPGEIIRVMVLGIENEGERISLGRRQVMPNPWTEAAKHLEVGAIMDGVITRPVATGAFARLRDFDIEGFIPLRELSSRRINRADEAVQKGQAVQVKLVDVKPEAHKMTLSLVGAEAERNRQEYEDYMKSQQGSTVKLGDRFGDMLNKARESLADPDESGEAETSPAADAEQDAKSKPESEAEPASDDESK